MNMDDLDQEERELLTLIASGEWQSVEDVSAKMAEHKTIAKNTLKKDKRVNLRISARDLEALKAYAAEEGLPYQTLMSSVLHKFVSGRLVECKAG